jgi:hypothetical protein
MWPMLGFGVESHSADPAVMDLMQQAGITLMRRNGLLWSAIEPMEGTRDWETQAKFEKELVELHNRGIQIILIVRDNPPWAQKIPGVSCGPISAEKFQAFAAFMHDLVARYSQPPYSVKYWELGNEVDIDPMWVPPDNFFGCWGDENDEFYGGSYYGEMLKVVYPAIKSADPDAQVLIGGLLLDCDPGNPPNETATCLPAKFFEGILRSGAGNSFDIVSYHGYPQYNGTLDSDETFRSWDKRGGVVLGKAHFLREVMSKYFVQKPLMLTETSLLCLERNTTWCNPPGDDFYDAQAEYLARLYVKTWAAGISATVWYQFEGPGWRFGGLLEDSRKPKPAYQALSVLINQLNGLYFLADLSGQYPGLKVYEFGDVTRRMWVLWPMSADGAGFRLPQNVMRILDKFGEEIPASGGDELWISGVTYFELAVP